MQLYTYPRSNGIDGDNMIILSESYLLSAGYRIHGAFEAITLFVESSRVPVDDVVTGNGTVDVGESKNDVDEMMLLMLVLLMLAIINDDDDV